MKKVKKGKTQSARLLEYLQANTKATALQCHEELSIMHPAGRIRDLRKQGWPIGTNYYQQIDARGVEHRAAQYYLQREKLTPEQQNILI
ncbi:helix-turn-helix domain-containing protein [Desulfocastanea catecholica]